MELQASTPEVKSYLDTAEKLSQQGSYSESFQQLQKALDVCTSKRLVGDKPLIQAKLAAASFVQGKLDDAKEYWVRSLSDSQTASNLVLQADVLVAISSMAQQAGNLTEALDLLTKALDLARKSKNLFMQSRRGKKRPKLGPSGSQTGPLKYRRREHSETSGGALY